MHAAHGVAGPLTSGNFTGTYAPVTVGDGPVVKVVGLTVENSSAAALGVILRDGGSTGPIVAAGIAPLKSGSVNGIFDVDLHNPRISHNGLYVEVDGTAAAITAWVL
jgi:hypothetical protein